MVSVTKPTTHSNIKIQTASTSQATNTASVELISVATHLLDKARTNGFTISSAESCTGGMIAAAITAISGASDVFKGGVVSYTNEIKHNVLGVKQETLDTYDAVSEETVREMAQGVSRVIGSSISVSVSGFAGPTGGIKGKPVGTVCFGYLVKAKSTAANSNRQSPTEQLYSETCHFLGDRDSVRLQATVHALKHLADLI